jgi:hypothetical protein
MNRVRSIVGMIPKGQNGRTWRKFYPRATFSTTNSRPIDLELKPGLCWDKLENDSSNNPPVLHI